MGHNVIGHFRSGGQTFVTWSFCGQYLMIYDYSEVDTYSLGCNNRLFTPSLKCYLQILCKVTTRKIQNLCLKSCPTIKLTVESSYTLQQELEVHLYFYETEIYIVHVYLAAQQIKYS